MKSDTIRQQVRLFLLRLVPYLSWPLIAINQQRHPFIRSPSVDRVLLIRPDHLGDILLATPALRLLRQALPQAHIAAMVGPWSREVLANNPNLDELLLCPFPGFTRRPKPSPFQPYTLLWRYARRLKGKNFDLAIILRFDHWWGALLAYLAGIPRRIGYDVAEVKTFLTDALPHVPGRHEVEQNIALVKRVANGEWRGRGTLEFRPLPEDEKFAAHYLAERGIGEEVLICIHPGAGAPVKLWREEGWAEVGDALARRYGARIVLTGSGEEESLCRAIAKKMAMKSIMAAGETTLGQLAALMRRCLLVIGVDSGPMHLAVAMGTPTVHLYGPVDSRAFGPWGDPAWHVVLSSDMDCIPCNRLDYAPEELSEHPCVRRIRVEQVLEAAEQLLGISLAN